MPIGVAVEGANRHDMKLVRPTIERVILDRPEPTEERPQGLCLDKGYDYTDVREVLQEFGFAAHLRARGGSQDAENGSGIPGPPGVVGRAHSWMNRFRRLLVRWDKKPQNYLAFLHFACGLIAFRTAGLFG